MSDDKQIQIREGRGKKSWLWTILSGVVIVLGLLVLIGFSAVLIKWGLIALLVYGAFVLGRRLLSSSSDSETSETPLLTDGDFQPDAIALLEQDRDLDELKARMTDASGKSKKGGQ